MKGIILYTSKYGSSKKYADWLHQATGFETLETKKADINALSGYDTVILGGGIYAGSIAGLGFLRKNISALGGKKLAVYYCCASPYDEDADRQVRQQNMKDGLEDIPCFYCRGTFDLNSMSFAHRTLCKMLIKSVSKKPPQDLAVWERGLLEAKDTPCDWADKEYLDGLIEYINK